VPCGSLDDLRAIAAVAHDRSFTKASARLGISQSALSQTIRQLEARLGVRLLTCIDAQRFADQGRERLTNTAAPRLEKIAAKPAAHLIVTQPGSV
jgi:DNA-binding transcriptional LysR family regulator